MTTETMSNGVPALDHINLKQLASFIKRSLSQNIATYLEDSWNYVGREAMTSIIEHTLQHLQEQNLINKPTVKCSHAVGYQVETKRNRVTACYVLNDESLHTIHKKFYGRRTARYHARKNYRYVLFADVAFMPVASIQHINVNVLVANYKGQ